MKDISIIAIVILVPEICTDIFRFTIESLFITYAEPELNTIGNVLNPNPIPDSNPWLLRGSSWCEGLLRRPQPKAAHVTDRNQS